jgi:predicted TIM-barrel fold metal-dependent hydrolase
MNPRRRFLGSVATLTAGVLLPARDSRAQRQAGRGSAGQPVPIPKPRRIDVHHHYQSPGWTAVLAAARLGRDAFDAWTPAKAVEDMDKAGVDLAMTSAATYLAHQADLVKKGVAVRSGDNPRRYAREANEYGAKIVADYKGRFGLFAVLPFPDNDSSLREIDHALDALKADGFALATSYADKYLGDPVFAPVLDELNRRRAIVYTHPATADCCFDILPKVGAATLEYGNDTARTIMSLLANGAAAKYPDIRWIFSHAGGTVPFLIERILGRPNVAQKLAGTPKTGDRLYELRRFYYDTAQASNPAAMSALRKVVPVSQILFGTDYPYSTMADHVDGLKDSGVFNAEELRAIDRDNALRLLPKYKTT